MKVRIFRQKQRFKIGMADKFYAEKVMGLPFVPVRTLINMRNCGDFRIISIRSGANYNPAEFSKMVKIIDGFQLLFINPVNTCDRFNKKVFPQKNLGRFWNFFRGQLNIKMIAFGLIICLFRTKWSFWFLGFFRL